MGKTIIMCMLLLCLMQLYAQKNADTIVVNKPNGGVFRLNGKVLTPGELGKIVQTNEDANKEMKIAKTNNDVGFVFGCVGGFMIGWPLGAAIAGGKPNWAIFGAGVGLAIVSIPFSVAYSKHANNAVRIYNRSLKQTGMTNINMRLGLTGVGIDFIF